LKTRRGVTGHRAGAGRGGVEGVEKEGVQGSVSRHNGGKGGGGGERRLGKLHIEAKRVKTTVLKEMSSFRGEKEGEMK